MDNFIVTVSPHIHAKDSTMTIMRDVLIALCPALIASVLFFGVRALLVAAVCVATAVLFEWAFEKICKRPNTVGDLSAAVTGLILALNLPVSIPLWQAAFGSLIAIVLVKQLFGGIGHNFANPAMTARIVMLLLCAHDHLDGRPLYRRCFRRHSAGGFGQRGQRVSAGPVPGQCQRQHG